MDSVESKVSNERFSIVFVVEITIKYVIGMSCLGRTIALFSRNTL